MNNQSLFCLVAVIAKPLPLYEVNKEVVLSTAHISGATNHMLRVEDPTAFFDLLVDQVTDEKIRVLIDYNSRLELQDAIIPEDLKGLMLIAYDFDAKWLLLDRDARVMDNLKTYG